jgi:hypothetical protein
MTPLSGAFALLALASLADVLSTRAALRAEPGFLHESNPLMRPFVGCTRRALAVKLAGVLVMGWLASDMAKTAPRAAALLLLTAALSTSWLAWRNVRLLRAVQRHDVRFPNGSRLVVWPGDVGYDETAPVTAAHYDYLASRPSRFPGIQTAPHVGDTEDDIAELRAAAREIDEQVRMDAILERLAETDAFEARMLAGCS